jgi:peptidyl-prolyl cis-trans isomerase C
MSIILRFFRDPLLHFALLGGLIFMGHDLIANTKVGQPTKATLPGNTITLKSSDVNLIVQNWQKMNFRPPSKVELDGIIEKRVKEEILYREALKLGLEKDDTIVRRRLAQKMAFFSEGLVANGKPTTTELEEYLADNLPRFTPPATIHFEQIYFNPELHEGNKLEKIIGTTLALLQEERLVDDTNLGDRFLLGAPSGVVSQTRVATTFGQEFATTLFATSSASWQGPIPSSFGEHLVYIHKLTRPPVPKLEEVKEQVKEALLSDARQNALKTYLTLTREKYQIEIELTGVEFSPTLPERKASK